ncbi:MAG: TolC family protein, partial [Candidatus Omnitrophica bacterium]|nr:TolC family protein [Candidatus Omnitrophota bacterium]
MISWAGEAGVYQLSAGQNTEPRLIRLEQLMQALRQRNPDVIAAKAEWMAAKKRVWIDSSLPDPMAGYDLMGGMRETRTGPEEQRFMVSQEIPFPSKLWEKGKAAQDEAQAAYQRYRAIER